MTGIPDLADELRRIGREAGLDSVGICHAEPFDGARTAIEHRRASGESAGMQFTFRNPARSTDPRATLPVARALFVGARGYYRQPVGPAGPAPAARVARYSWSDHYALLRRALGEVANRLVEEGWSARVLVDDNALVDRAAAVRAGLGWYGKNTNVLLPGKGSWFVLGSVVTDAPIAPVAVVEEVADGCGGCRRCLTDCPTGALVEPGRLDARRCLAWLLQAPGPFPVEHREALGDRIYGCDACQERCPVNRRALADRPAAAAGPADRPWLAALDLLDATDGELERLVGRWYIPGREMRYVRRNALVVLGNVARGDDPAVVAALRRYLDHDDPLLRGHAVWAAGRLGRRDLIDERDDDDGFVTGELARARAPK